MHLNSVKNLSTKLFILLNQPKMICLFVFILFSVLPILLESGCFSKNPGFDSDPRVRELSPQKIKAEWRPPIMNDVDCVDHFFIYCWKTKGDRNKGQKIQRSKKTFSVEIDVEDDTEYALQINAFEDGCCAWNGDNWSKVVKFETSKGMRQV